MDRLFETSSVVGGSALFASYRQRSTAQSQPEGHDLDHIGHQRAAFRLRPSACDTAGRFSERSGKATPIPPYEARHDIVLPMRDAEVPRKTDISAATAPVARLMDQQQVRLVAGILNRHAPGADGDHLPLPELPTNRDRPVVDYGGGACRAIVDGL